MPENVSVSFDIPMDASAGGVPGDVVCLNSTGTAYVLATTANLGTKKSSGILRTASDANGSVAVQAGGPVNSTITGLAPLAGVPQYAYVTALGRLARTVTIGALEVVGLVDCFGNVTCDFSGAFMASVAASGTAGGVLAGTYPNPTLSLSSNTSLTGTLPTTKGGTGLTTRGTSHQVLRTNGDGTVLEYSNVDLTDGAVTGPLPVAKGGSGLTAVGSALQVLRTNAGATGLEWGTEGAGDVDVFNILDYVQGGDGGDYALAAIRALRAMRHGHTANTPVAGYRGILHFPVLVGGYRFKQSVPVTATCVIRGAVRGGVQIICDDWVTAFVVKGSVNSSDYGNDAAASIIKDIEFVGGPQASTLVNTANTWLQGRVQVAGDWIIPGNAGCPTTDFVYDWTYSYLCIKGGTNATCSAAQPANPLRTQPTYSDYFTAGTPTDYSAGPRPWSPLGTRTDLFGTPYQSTFAVGDVIKVADRRLAVATDIGEVGPDNLFYAVTAIGTGGSYTGATPGLLGTVFPQATAAGQVFYNGGCQLTSFTTGEPEWRLHQTPDESVQWTAGRLNFFGDVVRPTAATNRWDAVFHCESPTTGTAGSGSQPAGFGLVSGAGVVFGEAVTDGSTTWRCWSSGAETKPIAYVPGVAAYARGDKRTAASGQRFVCKTAGNSGGGAPAAFAAYTTYFTDVTDGTAVWTSYNPGPYMVLDGTTVWATRVVAAVRMLAQGFAQNCGATRFTNSSLHVQADLYGAFTSGYAFGAGFVPGSNASFVRVNNWDSYQCGAVITTRGGDVNAGSFTDIGSYGTCNYPFFQGPDLGINERGFLGNFYQNVTMQSVGGSAFTSSTASSGAMFQSHLEGCGLITTRSITFGIWGGVLSCEFPVKGRGMGLGGDSMSHFASDALWYGTIGQYTHGLKDVSSISGNNKDCEFYLGEHSMSSVAKDGNGYYSWIYEGKATGWWSHNYSNQANKNAVSVSTDTADRGSGYSWCEKGILVGNGAKTLVGNDNVMPDGFLLSNTTVGWRGDFFHNYEAAVGAPIGWVCTVGTGANIGTMRQLDNLDDDATRTIRQPTVRWGTGAIHGIRSSTNATPIVVTTLATHPFLVGQTVRIAGHLVNTAAVGDFVVSAVSATTLTLTGSVGNGVGAATGNVRVVLPARDENRSYLLTAGATPAVLETYALPINAAERVSYRVVAKLVSAVGSACWEITVGAERSGSGVAVVKYNPGPTLLWATDGLFAPTPLVAGSVAVAAGATTGNIDLTVTGIAATNIHWSCERTGLEGS